MTAAAALAHKVGLRVNAGHGLNYLNTPGILEVPHLEVLNTGHSIISRSLFVGLRQAVGGLLIAVRNALHDHAGREESTAAALAAAVAFRSADRAAHAASNP